MVNLDVPGEMTPQELKAIEAVAGLVPALGVVVEVGSYLGRSSWHWAKNAHPSATIYCLDPWDGYRGSSLEKFGENVCDCPNIIPVQGYSPKDYGWWDKQIDLYFEDAVHKNPVLHENLTFWSGFLKPNGIVCGHDYSPKFKDVIQEAQALARETKCRLYRVESFWCLLQERMLADRQEVAEVARVLEKLAERVIEDFRHEISTAGQSYQGKVGATVEISGAVRNATSASWPISAGQYSVKVGARIFSTVSGEKLGEARASLACNDLASGDSCPFLLELALQGYEPGEYEVAIDLVVDYSYWFADRGATPVSVALRVI